MPFICGPFIHTEHQKYLKCIAKKNDSSRYDGGVGQTESNFTMSTLIRGSDEKAGGKEGGEGTTKVIREGDLVIREGVEANTRNPEACHMKLQLS